MIRFFKEFKRKDWILTVISIVLIIVQVNMDLNLPAYMSRMTVTLQKPGTRMDDIMLTGAVMLLYALGSMIASCITAICVSALSFSVGGSLRSKLFHQVMQLSLTDSDEFSSASLITRSTNDITQVQTLLVMGLQIIVKAPLTALGAIGRVSGMVWQWTAVTAGGTVLIVIFVVGCVAFILPKQKKVQQLTDELNRIADENLSGISVIHAYNAEKTAENKFSDTNAMMTKNNLFVIRAMAFLNPSIQLILNGMTLAIYWIGALVISQTEFNSQAGVFANMLAFAQYATQIVSAFVTLTMVFTMIPRAMVSFNRIVEVIETEPSVRDGKFAGKTDEKGTIEFKNVTFSYSDYAKPVISNVSFTIKQGETVALIGATGSGKSTIINMIPRFYDASAGAVLVDGINVKDYRLEDLRNKIGYVPQQTMLLSGSIRSNVCYGTQTDSHLAMALKTSQADEFVSDPDAPVMQDGANFSGGQKQRLAIARALTKAPEMLIFDDASSALDYETERKLKKQLNTNYHDTTKIVITQRIGSVRDADQIIVLDNGQIVGQGTHEDLMRSCDVYQQMAQTQKEALL